MNYRIVYEMKQLGIMVMFPPNPNPFPHKEGKGDLVGSKDDNAHPFDNVDGPGGQGACTSTSTYSDTNESLPRPALSSWDTQMTELWHSLYIQTDEPERVIEALISALSDYQRYDPFPGGTGTPPGFKTFIKLFIAPPADGWCRVLGSLESETVLKLSRHFKIIRVWLGDSEGAVEIYQDGVLSQPQAISAAQESPAAQSKVETLLPDELQQFAESHGVDMKQADKMLNKLTAQVFGKLDRASGNSASQMQDQARGLITKPNRVNWNSPAGQQIRFVAQGLGLPKNWREPDFDSLREAYQVARRLKKNPQARLLPDEQAELKAVPDAASYQAVYLGK